jgi:hypothetical protein
MHSGYGDPPDKVEWEAPEVKQRKGSKWDPIASMLKANPGRWACIGRNIPTSIVTVMKKGELVCFRPAGSFEATVRNHTDRWQGDVYARYIGEDGEHK